MTVGIAATGPFAGLATFRALAAVEALGRGAIGGFVSFVAISGGRLLTAETQKGGSRALFGADDPPSEMAAAPVAGLMSSGPDRPEPLIQFTPADPQVGLVSGHRLPNNPATEGIGPPNLHALRLLSDGVSASEAVARTLGAAPSADAGLIAASVDGTIALGNTAHVATRDDIGEALAHDPATGLRIGLLHNSIFPVAGLAGAALAAGFDAAAPADAYDRTAPVEGLPIRAGSGRALHLGARDVPMYFTSPDPGRLGPEWEGSAVVRGDPVFCEGRLAGCVVWEPYCITRNLVVTGGRGSTWVGWRSLRPGEPE